MSTLKAALAIALSFTVASTQVLAETQTRTIEYQVGDETFTGYMAWDDEFGQKRPGVLVVHEWWGHNEFARNQAERLASAGYTAFALDMYGSGKLAEHPEDAQAFMKEATKEVAGQFQRKLIYLKTCLGMVNQMVSLSRVLQQIWSSLNWKEAPELMVSMKILQ